MQKPAAVCQEQSRKVPVQEAQLQSNARRLVMGLLWVCAHVQEASNKGVLLGGWRCMFPAWAAHSLCMSACHGCITMNSISQLS